MDTFVTNAKLWPSGLELNQGIDSNSLGGPYNPTRQAPLFASDGTTTYKFLFWNTGRHLTSKRNVKWIFSVLGWGVWTATRWYGIPGGPGSPGSELIRANAFSIGGNQSLGSATPIDAAASTFPAGAHPVGIDDHLVSTANGDVSIAAKDPYDTYDFAGWLQIMMGGDDISEFIETDSGSGGTIGGVGFYDHVTGGAGKFQGAQHSSADLLATYGYHPPPGRGDFIPDRLRDWIYELILDDMRRKPGPEIIGDSSPIDRIRGKLLEALVAQARPGGGGPTDFQALIEAAPTMNPAELKRAVQSLKTTLDLGKTALGAMESRLKGK
jgi:hypothetical protein